MKLKNLIKNYNIFFVIFIIMLGFFIVSSLNYNESFSKRRKNVKSKNFYTKTCHDPEFCGVNETKLIKCENDDIITNNNMKKDKRCKNNQKWETQEKANTKIDTINCHTDINRNIYDKNEWLIYECAANNEEINDLKEKGFKRQENIENNCSFM
tara:strand:- start:2332 stop:2793 length:462 start_codon:yes stop_codon:yes gene_type:complete